ncbi:TPR-like protein [Apiospora marii]|uniref:TPR-like protein n=1 Tax=Apiospora marii TaxID=335849 RepID=UPI00312D220B
MSAYEQIATEAKLQFSPQTPLDEICQLARRWMEGPGSFSWVMVLDGLDNRFLESRRFLPTKRGAIIVTTRQREVVGDVVDPSQGIEVPNLADEEAKALVESRLGDRASEAVREQDELFRLCNLLENHPLALVQAGDKIRNLSIRVSEFLTQYIENDEQREEFLRYSGRYTWDDSERPSLAVMTMWFVTIKDLAKSNPSALDLLDKIALLSEEFIPRNFLQGQQKAVPFIETMAPLINYSLVFNMGFEGYRMHRLVAYFLRKTMELDETRYIATVTGTIDHVASVYPGEDRGSEVSQVLPHALAIFRHSRSMGIMRLSVKVLGRPLALCLLHLGSLRGAKEHIATALQVHDNLVATPVDDDAGFLEDAARVFWRNDDNKNMLDRISQAAQIYEGFYGHFDNRTLTATRRKAMALKTFGRQREVIEMHRDDLAKIEDSHHRDTELAFSTMNSIGSAYQELGEWKDSVHWQQRALHGYLGHLGKSLQDEKVIQVQIALARAYSKSERFGEAHSLLQSCEDETVRQRGADHIEVAMVWEDIAEVYLDEKRYDKAIDKYHEALAGYERANAFPGKIMSNLGEAYKRGGRFIESERYFKRSLTQKEEKYGKEHRSTLISLRNLGDLYETKDELTQALHWYRQALARSKKLGGPTGGAECAWASHLISRVLLKQNRYADALRSCQQSLDGFKELYEDRCEEYEKYKQCAKLYQSILGGLEKESDEEAELRPLI